jgi:exosortase/archaeosortase family protein
MSSKKKKNLPKNKKGKQQASFNPIGSVKAWFKDRHPVIKFLLGFIGCMTLFYLFYYSSLYRNNMEIPFLNVQANISNFLLNIIGHNTSVSDTSIYSNEFSVNIKSGCDGLEAMAILVSGILIFPTAFRLKAIGLLWGIGTLFVLNLFRISGLYLAGLYFSKTVFDVLHIQGGFIIFTMISILLWFIWMNWSLKKEQQNV